MLFGSAFSFTIRCIALLLSFACALAVVHASTALAQTTGEQRTLVTLVNFQNDPSMPVTPAQIDLELLDEANAISTASYIREASCDRAWLTGSVSGWHTMPWDDTTCFISTQAGAQQVLDELDPQIDWSLVDRWIIYIPFHSSCVFSGISSLGKDNFTSAEGPVTLSRIVINGQATTTLGSLGSHELGHSFGLPHARDFECGSVSAADECEATPWLYGARYDVLGDTNGYGHFNPPGRTYSAGSTHRS